MLATWLDFTLLHTLAGWSMGTWWPALLTVMKDSPPPLFTCPATAPPTFQSIVVALRNTAYGWKCKSYNAT